MAPHRVGSLDQDEDWNEALRFIRNIQVLVQLKTDEPSHASSK